MTATEKGNQICGWEEKSPPAEDQKEKSVEQSCNKSSRIGKTASVPCLYYIVPRAKAVLLCTENTSLNKTGNQFSQIVFIMFLALLTLSRETIFKSSGQKWSFYLQARKHRKREKTTAWSSRSIALFWKGINFWWLSWLLRVQFLDAVSVLQIEVCQRDASQTAADALCPRGKTD